jgi:uncharacterized membrane protein
MSKSPAQRKPSLSANRGTTLEVRSVSQTFEGPIPHPAILKQYDDFLPGSADRLIKLAELEAQHRRAQENAATTANIAAQQKQLALADYQTRTVFKSDALGQALGFVVSMTCVLGSVYLAIAGQVWIAAALAGLPLVGIIRALRGKP